MWSCSSFPWTIVSLFLSYRYLICCSYALTQFCFLHQSPQTIWHVKLEAAIVWMITSSYYFCKFGSYSLQLSLGLLLYSCNMCMLWKPKAILEQRWVVILFYIHLPYETLIFNIYINKCIVKTVKFVTIKHRKTIQTAAYQCFSNTQRLRQSLSGKVIEHIPFF